MITKNMLPNLFHAGSDILQTRMDPVMRVLTMTCEKVYFQCHLYEKPCTPQRIQKIRPKREVLE